MAADKERLVKLETQMESVLIGQTRMENKLDKFINSMDDRFAQKEMEIKIRDMELDFKDFQKCTDKRIDSNSMKIAMYSGAVGILMVIIQLGISSGFFKSLFGGI